MTTPKPLNKMVWLEPNSPNDYRRRRFHADPSTSWRCSMASSWKSSINQSDKDSACGGWNTSQLQCKTLRRRWNHSTTFKEINYVPTTSRIQKEPRAVESAEQAEDTSLVSDGLWTLTNVTVKVPWRTREPLNIHWQLWNTFGHVHEQCCRRRGVRRFRIEFQNLNDVYPVRGPVITITIRRRGVSKWRVSRLSSEPVIEIYPAVVTDRPGQATKNRGNKETINKVGAVAADGVDTFEARLVAETRQSQQVWVKTIA